MVHIETATDLVQARSWPPELAVNHSHKARPARSPAHPIGAALTCAHVVCRSGRVVGKCAIVIGTIEACTFR